jgi:hypothetical protein
MGDRCLNCGEAHDLARVPPFLCGPCEDAKYFAAKDQAWWDAYNQNKGSAYREELTPEGIQLSWVPAPEGKPNKAGAAQLSLF